MGVTFNADEIFEMAEQIERNGVKFYRRAAEILSDQNARTMLLDLAVMEAEHAEIFADMRRDFSEQHHEPVVFDPDEAAALYLRAMADGYVFDTHTDPAELLTGKESKENIIQMAIGLEKDSIAFYLGLKDLVSSGAEKDKVEAIIKEEMHISALSTSIWNSSSSPSVENSPFPAVDSRVAACVW